MIDLCPLDYLLVDCVQIPLDEEFNRILIYAYTDSPDRPYDAFVSEEYDIPKEVPLYLHIELWEWEKDKYIRKWRKEEKIGKEEAKILTERYLRFIVQLRPEDMSYRADYNLKQVLAITPYYQLEIGCRWNRAWLAFSSPTKGLGGRGIFMTRL
jgi:hypothetical protein